MFTIIKVVAAIVLVYLVNYTLKALEKEIEISKNPEVTDFAF